MQCYRVVTVTCLWLERHALSTDEPFTNIVGNLVSYTVSGIVYVWYCVLWHLSPLHSRGVPDRGMEKAGCTVLHGIMSL